jgi:hypothetical protein
MARPDEAVAGGPDGSAGVEVLRAVWAADGGTVDLPHRPSPPTQPSAFDEECGPTKTCRNMRDFTFDGMAEPGTDLGTAWRERLRREGKLSAASGSIRDLVLGRGPDPAARPNSPVDER